MVEYANVITARHNKEKAEKARQAQLREQGYKDYDGLSENGLNQGEQDETDTRKLAAEHMHVSEWKVREVQEMEKKSGNILWQTLSNRA